MVQSTEDHDKDLKFYPKSLSMEGNFCFALLLFFFNLLKNCFGHWVIKDNHQKNNYGFR